tara:strand:- start:242 stop:490 length:249 start_codon:yes stop_codon:yes gene_type:complete
MKGLTEKQLLEWKEELAKQIKTRDQAKKVFDESTTNINVLQGGVQFAEILLKKNESINQPSNKEALNQQQGKMSSKLKGSPA